MMRTIDAIESLIPNAEYEFDPIKNKILKWYSKEKQPSEEAIQAKLKELEDEYEKQAYARSRQQEYPDLQECIHAILDDDLTALQAKRKLVKEKYPKPE